MRVNTIYPSFMGEVNMYGVFAPCTFVRLSGCNLRCYKKLFGTCDTPESLDKESGEDMTITAIINEVKKYGNEIVCLTGGEPLLQNCTDLLVRLSNRGYKVVIETNGSMAIHPYRHLKNVSFVVDFKTDSTGHREMMAEDNYRYMDSNDFLKFVVYDNNDLENILLWRRTHKDFEGKIAIGICWGGKVTYKQLFEFIRNKRFHNTFVNMQTHKLAMLYDECGGDIAKHTKVPTDL